MEKMYLSIVIPCFDEIENLQKGVLDKVIKFLEKQKYTYEVLIIDDGSKDGSVKFLEKFAKQYPQMHVIKNHHSGKAGAVTSGMLAAKGEYLLFTDMDQATPIEEVDKLLPFFERGFDIVIGSRNTARKGSPWIRVVISRSSIILRKLIVGLGNISDTQCGFKMFRHDIGKNIFTKIHTLHQGFKQISQSSVTSGFDVEILLIATKMGYSIKEVPIIWSYVETRRVNPIKDSIEGVKDLLKIKINDMRKMYG